MTDLDRLKLCIYDSNLSTEDANFVIDAFEKADEENFIEITESVMEMIHLSASPEEYMTEGTEISAADQLKAEAVLLGGTVACAALIALCTKINNMRIAKGYERDPELQKIKSELDNLKTKIDTAQKKYKEISKKMIDQCNEYNSVVKTVGAPTIKVTTVTKIPQSYHDAYGWHTQWVEKRSLSEEQNRNYDPEKAKLYEARLKNLKPIIDKYVKVCDELDDLNMDLAVVKGRLNRLAKKKATTEKAKNKREEKKDQIRTAIKNAEDRYNKAEDHVKESADDEGFENYRNLKLRIYESGMDSEDINTIIGNLESCDEENFQEMCESVEELLDDIE